MAYTFDEPKLGLLQIAQTDAGVTPPNQSTLIPTPPNKLGMIVRAFDPTFGEGEFILLTGVAANIVGAVVTYNNATYTPTLLPNTANLAQPIAVSMVANTATTTFSWYQISGVAVVKKIAIKVNPAVALYISSTTGRVSSTSASGKQLLGTRSANSTTIASATSTVNVIIDRPHLQGQIT